MGILDSKHKETIFMQAALKEARQAYEAQEIPVGAVIVYDDRIIARAHNQVKLLKDPTAHAEMLAITQAADYLKNERLVSASMFVTIEPCAMCAGALVLARINRLFFGAADPKTGACGSVFNIVHNERLNHSLEVHAGLLSRECGGLISRFMQERRQSITGAK